ncbi:autoinducer binding domain-containing protein [Mesorhizobium sp. M1163]|uniref:helix-turn-helix transcriptional regulator n=1 Tax=Mesorhizobium sp. M1163 TaxID=2957065 RepID=UPI00333B222D
MRNRELKPFIQSNAAGRRTIDYRTPAWRRTLDDTYEFMRKLQTSSTTTEICARLLDFAGRFGATNLLAGLIPPPGALQREQISHVLLDAWPHQWSERYFSNSYLCRDPTIQLVNRGSSPFLWDEIGQISSVSHAGGRIMKEAGEFRLRAGLTMAFATAGQQPVGFSIAGEKLEPHPNDRMAFHLVAAYALGCTIILTKKRDHRSVHLSPRQLDVLRWASEGLAVDAIAERLDISSHTADIHMRAIRQKLGVRSTVHAVAEAFRIGLIT